jgi:hypothetical protein
MVKVVSMPGDDIPAAHSMDTQWFAVDAEGNVGLFDTGEDGALPNDAGNLGGPSDANFDALLFYAALAARRVLAGTWQPPDNAWLSGLKTGERVLAVLPSAPSDAADFDVLSVSPWVGLSRKPMKPARLQELARLGTLVDTGIFYELFEFHEEPPGQSGEVFLFRRDHGDDPGLYQRVVVPPTSLKVDELPPVAREAIGALTVKTAFAASETFHLADHIADDQAFYYRDGWTLRSFGPDADGPNVAASARRRETRRMLWFAGVILLIGLAVLLGALFPRR